MAHTCHATDCPQRVPPAMFMCRKHWYTLPRSLRDRIWATYRDGQEDDKQPSHAYCEAAKAAVIYIAEREGKVPDVRLYEIYDPGATT